jgi:hypothetical protein
MHLPLKSSKKREKKSFLSNIFVLVKLIKAKIKKKKQGREPTDQHILKIEITCLHWSSPFAVVNPSIIMCPEFVQISTEEKKWNIK